MPADRSSLIRPICLKMVKIFRVIWSYLKGPTVKLLAFKSDSEKKRLDSSYWAAFHSLYLCLWSKDIFAEFDFARREYFSWMILFSSWMSPLIFEIVRRPFKYLGSVPNSCVVSGAIRIKSESKIVFEFILVLVFVLVIVLDEEAKLTVLVLFCVVLKNPMTGFNSSLRSLKLVFSFLSRFRMKTRSFSIKSNFSANLTSSSLSKKSWKCLFPTFYILPIKLMESSAWASFKESVNLIKLAARRSAISE